MVEEDETEDNMEDLQGLVSFSPVVMGGLVTDSRRDLPVCSADCHSDWLSLSPSVALFLSTSLALKGLSHVLLYLPPHLLSLSLLSKEV